jgi:hypothetical protein
MTNGTAVFLDTSIQIARIVHADEVKGRIKDSIDGYDLRVISLVVKQEFKRRLLEQVVWCLNQLNHPSNPKTYEQLIRHVTDFTPAQRENEKKIRQQILMTVMGGPANDLTERANRLLRVMLRTALSVFDGENDHVVRASGCACASYPIVEKKPYKRYELGPNKCTECDRKCGVEQFLADRDAKLTEILAILGDLPTSKKTNADGRRTQLGKIEDFIVSFQGKHDSAAPNSPCLTVGDLIIALESAGIPDFYTINVKESQYLCRAMGQTMIWRKPYHIHPDIKRRRMAQLLVALHCAPSVTPCLGYVWVERCFAPAATVGHGCIPDR